MRECVTSFFGATGQRLLGRKTFWGIVLGVIQVAFSRVPLNKTAKNFQNQQFGTVAFDILWATAFLALYRTRKRAKTMLLNTRSRTGLLTE